MLDKPFPGFPAGKGVHIVIVIYFDSFVVFIGFFYGFCGN